MNLTIPAGVCHDAVNGILIVDVSDLDIKTSGMPDKIEYGSYATFYFQKCVKNLEIDILYWSYVNKDKNELKIFNDY